MAIRRWAPAGVSSLIICLLVNSAAAQTPPESSPAGQPAATTRSAPACRSYDELTRVLRELADGSGGTAALEKIATTAGQRTVWSLRLAASGDVPVEKRLGILVVSGIDADAPSASDIALDMAAALLHSAREEPDSDAAKLLKTRTLYVVPRVSPDGVETYFDPVKRGERVNARAVDDDRDGVANEDGPNDLDGDGQITVMRVKDRQGEWIVDKDDPRLMKKADRIKGEVGLYRLLPEGIDDDGDGQINEDGPGGVDPDRNWPHFFEPGVLECGQNPLSEPETRGLAEFVLAHRNIAVAIVLGRNDNVVNVQKGQARGPNGRDYKELHPDDVKLYEGVSEKYKEITGIKTVPVGRVEGALYSWLYSQEGIATFAVNPWWPLDSLPAASQPASSPASGPTSGPTSGPAAGASDRPAEAPAAESPPPGGGRGPGGPGGRGGRRGGGRGPGGRGPGAGPPGGFPGGPPGTPAPGGEPAASSEGLAGRVEASEALKKWIRFANERMTEPAFVAWTAVQHPTLGPIEVGGLRPYVTTVPPSDELPKLVDQQIAFLKHLNSLLPAPRFARAKVKDLGGGIWQVDVRMVNDSIMPTHLAISRHIGNPSIVLKPLVPAERVIGGPLQDRIEFLPAGGEAQMRRWLLRGNAGEKVTFRAFNRVFGELKTDIELKATAPGEGE